MELKVMYLGDFDFNDVEVNTNNKVSKPFTSTPNHKANDNVYELLFDRKTQYDGTVMVTGFKDGKPVAFQSVKKSRVADYMADFKADDDMDERVSANTFIRHLRQKKELFSLNNVVIDIDFHNKEYNGDLQEFLKEFIGVARDYVSKYIPIWDVANLTGGGVQFWWSIEQVHKQYLNTYTDVVVNIIHLFEALLTDYPKYSVLDIDKGASKNAAGLFRAFDSFNTRAQRKTVTIWEEKKSKKVTLQELDLRLKLLYDTGSNKTDEAIQSTAKTVKYNTSFTEVAKFRLKVVEAVVPYKNRKIGEERRNFILLVYYSTLKAIYSSADAKVQAKEFNRMLFKEPLESIDEIFAYVDSVEGQKLKGRLMLTNKTIIEYLGMTKEDEDMFNFYERGEVNKTRSAERKQRKSEKVQRDEQIFALYRQGYTLKVIAEETGCSTYTVHGVVKRQSFSEIEKFNREVIELKQRGYNQKEIAERLGVNLSKVKRHYSQ